VGDIDAARGDYESHRWAAAVERFEAAGGFSDLTPVDTERLAWSITWTGRPAAVCLDAFERVETAYRRSGDRHGAARAALEQARLHGLGGHDVIATACWLRALELVDDENGCAEYGLAHALGAYGRLLVGDVVGARESAATARENLVVSGRDQTVAALAGYVEGQVETVVGDVTEGLRLLDRAISLIMTDAVHPMYAGIIYCGVLWACRQVGDWERAGQWNEVATRWCERESVAHFPAHLSVHRAELARVRGRFKEAEQMALEALDQAGDWSRDLVAWAHHQIGETRLSAGELSGAETAFACATELSYDPEPGRSRALLMRGEPEGAVRHIARAIDRRHWYALCSLVYTLPVGVSAAIAAGQLDTATKWSDRLEEVATRYGTRGPRAAAHVARGELALARGQISEAVQRLRYGVEEWTRGDAPYEAATARMLLAQACERAGHRDDAQRELGTARAIFGRIGAAWELERVDRLFSEVRRSDQRHAHRSPDAAEYGGLTPRQRQVATLVARGLTNPQIADELTISRLTAETHVRNILTALGVSTRAQIAVWAYEKGLAKPHSSHRSPGASGTAHPVR
jgi:ATP/maltotriose-dependent transcriptional regulator MalT